MNIYIAEYDFNRPLQKTITIPTNTTYNIGIGAIRNGSILQLGKDDVKLNIGDVEIAATGTYNGYVTFDRSLGRTPETVSAKVKILGTSFDLMIVGKYSTKGEIGGAGGSGDDVTRSEFDAFVQKTDESIGSLNQSTIDNKNLINQVDGELETLNSNVSQMYTNDEIDNKINQFAAHYLTKRTGSEGSYSYPQFATYADLSNAIQTHTAENPQFFYGDEGHTPDKNDYCVVLSDETHDNTTTRYSFVGDWPDGKFRYQYTINESPLTEEQWKAINSGITSEKLQSIESAVATIPTQTRTFHVEYEDGGVEDLEVVVK